MRSCDDDLPLPSVVSSGLLFTLYLYVYTNYSIYPLAWDSSLTWLLAALGMDFCYYWVHRAAHGKMTSRSK